MSAQAFAIILIAGLALTAFVNWHIADFRRRRAMTPEDRAAEDAELHVPGDW